MMIHVRINKHSMIEKLMERFNSDPPHYVIPITSRLKVVSNKKEGGGEWYPSTADGT